MHGKLAFSLMNNDARKQHQTLKKFGIIHLVETMQLDNVSGKSKASVAKQQQTALLNKTPGSIDRIKKSLEQSGRHFTGLSRGNTKNEIKR